MRSAVPLPNVGCTVTDWRPHIAVTWWRLYRPVKESAIIGPVMAFLDFSMSATGHMESNFFCCCLTLGFPCQDNAMSSSRDANLSTEKENKAEKEDGDRCVAIDDFKTVHRQRQWRTWTFFYIKWCSLTRTLSGNITPCCLLLRPDLRGLIHLALISQIMKL